MKILLDENIDVRLKNSFKGISEAFTKFSLTLLYAKTEDCFALLGMTLGQRDYLG